MGRFAERYTEDQRQAIAAAQLDQGMTRKQAVAALAAGELGVDAIDMPIVTAGHFKRRELERRQGKKLHPALKQGTEEALNRAATLAASSVNRIADRIDKQKQPKAKDLTDLAQAIRAIRQATEPPKPHQSGARTKTLTQQEAEHSKNAGNGAQEQPSQRVRALLTEAKRTTNPNPQPHPSPPRTG